MTSRVVTLFEIPEVRMTRCGYTGEDGFEVGTAQYFISKYQLKLILKASFDYFIWYAIEEVSKKSWLTDWLISLLPVCRHSSACLRTMWSILQRDCWKWTTKSSSWQDWVPGTAWDSKPDSASTAATSTKRRRRSRRVCLGPSENVGGRWRTSQVLRS